MPAKRIQNRRRLKINSGKKFNLTVSMKIHKKIIIYFSLALCFSLFFFAFSMIVKKNFWDGKSKVALAVSGGDGASVLLFDPEYQQLTTINIPKHTEVEVAQQLGVWKIESLWQLGEQQKIGGKLLADTITKHFRFPVTAWAGEGALGFAEGTFSGIYSSLVGLYPSNLTFGDKVSLAWFSLHIPNARRVEINLEDTGYLVNTRLKGGDEGYVLSDQLPQRVLSLFADEEIAKNAYIVSISDATGERTAAQNVGNVVEVLGAKVALVDKEDERDIDCIVRGKNDLLSQRIAAVFNCRREDSESNFDSEIILGSQFAKRF